MNAINYAQLTHTLQQSDLESEDVVNIAFAVDKNYLKPCGVCINSIATHNPNIKFSFHILTDIFDRFGFDDLVKKFSNIHINIYQINSDIFKKFQTNSRFPTAMYFRLVLPEILKEKIKKFIYIDADILCLNSINEIFNVNIDHHVAGVVKDRGCTSAHLEKIGLISEIQYFNSGFLYINIEEWIKENVLEKFIQLINTQKFNFPDQDILNIILNNKVIFLDEKFNDTHQKYEKPIFMHFTSSPKPWSIAADSCDLYLSYYKTSPWFKVPLDPPRNYRDTKKLSKKFFKNKKYFNSLIWLALYLYRRAVKII